ncbi:MAG: hypothetical protein ABIM89_13685 [Mycobacteriales bacterium]
MTDAFQDLREQIESRLVVPPFEEIRQRRARKTQVAAVFASAAAVTAIVAGASVLSSDRSPGLPASVAAPGTELPTVDSTPSPSLTTVLPPASSAATTPTPRPSVVVLAAPRYLVTAPGWRLTSLDESRPMPNGKMLFENDNRSVGLHWRPASEYEAMVADRKHHAATEAPIAVDGRAGLWSVNKGDARPENSALWLAGDYSLELRGGGSEADFRALAATLKSVDEPTWIAALPDSALLPTEQAAVIAELRAGLPTPPGFDASRLAPLGTGITDRYQLGVLVAGQLACGWFDQWVEADKTGDTIRKARAAAALETSKSWPVLREMVAVGDFAESLWGYVDALEVDGANVLSKDWIRNRGYVGGLSCARP